VAKTPQTGGYELLRRLAAGGMGEVFVARKTGAADFEKHVALKLLLPHLTASPESVKRFYAEARLAARMHHPNIVEIFDVGEAEGRPFLAMQLVEGLSLAQYLRLVSERQLTVPLPIARAIALSVCEALSYAHGLTDSRGRPLKLVHRDVTPSNVLLSFTGAVQLTDFGIARIGDGHTSAGVLRGKASYVAPEQLTHETAVDTRADLYSLAVTLYELLTHDNPFRKDSQDETLAAVLVGKARPVRQVRPEVTVAMEAALVRAMARRPDERFPDATSFRKAFVDGPVASAPDLAEHLRLVAGPKAEPDGEEPGATKSQVLRVTHSVSAELTPSPGRRSIVAAAVGLVAVAALVAGVVLVTREASAPVQVEAIPAPEPAPITALPTDVPAEAPPAPEEQPAEPAAVAPEPAAAPRVSTPKPKAPPKPRPELRIGYLAADAEPWADVLVDGARVDRTPFSKYPLPVGRHEVVFRAPDGRQQVKAITVAEGATVSLRVDFGQK
jgi:serine/threonine-protein kinase